MCWGQRVLGNWAELPSSFQGSSGAGVVAALGQGVRGPRPRADAARSVGRSSAAGSGRVRLGKQSGCSAGWVDVQGPRSSREVSACSDS